uniref:Uncharacterized protein n=1 Tax=Populus alba TaxID=43335 RepID=A0A4U5MYY3_POPAL|nr:hypothetical protein D5086_0000286570 [Populus alba]
MLEDNGGVREWRRWLGGFFSLKDCGDSRQKLLCWDPTRYTNVMVRRITVVTSAVLVGLQGQCNGLGFGVCVGCEQRIKQFALILQFSVVIWTDEMNVRYRFVKDKELYR